MAKFELPVYNMQTEKVAKTYRRNIMPVNLYIRFEELSEKLMNNKMTRDDEMFLALEELFIETFPELTKNEYRNCTDTAEVLKLFRDIIGKSTKIQAGNSKN